MQIKQAADGSDSGGNAAGGLDKSGLEGLLFQSQSGLVMLREMQHRRANKWHEIAQTHGYRSLDDNEELGPDPAESVFHTKPHKQVMITARLIDHSEEKARLSRLVLSRARLETHMTEPRHSGNGQQQPNKALQQQHAAVKALAEAAHTQHRLSHLVGISVEQTRRSSTGDDVAVVATHHSLHAIQPDDMEAFIRFTHAKLTMSLPFERLFIRMKWLCTSHRYHVRQRMLALFHQQKAKNAPVSTATTVKIKNLNAVTAPTANGQGVVHCPLFVLSPIQLEAELSKLLQRHVGVDYSGAAGFNVVALKVQVDELLNKSLKITAIVDVDLNAPGSEHQSTELLLPNMQPFFTRSRMESHWDIRQFDILECNSDQQAAGGGGDLSLAAAHEFDDDPLLRNEWELLRLSDNEYTRIRVDALARSHFERSQVDLSSNNSSKSVTARPSSSKQGGDKSKSITTELDQVHVARRASQQDEQLTSADDEPLCPESIYMLYVLRIVSCRAKRLRLLRLFNYFHYIVLSRQGIETESHNISSMGNPVKPGERRRSSASSPPPLQRPTAARWRVEKHQGDFVVLENKRKPDHSPLDPSTNGEVNGADGAKEDREVIFSAARQDLETLERHMLRIASVFVRRQERDSLPSLKEMSSAPAPAGVQVMVIDRMQVLCDIYDCELSFLQAKLQLMQLLLKNGFEFTKDVADSSKIDRAAEPSASASTHTDAVLSVLQHRPLIDFSHAYFYESYVTETLHLELQASLQQQIHDHFAVCEAHTDSKQPPLWLERQQVHMSLVTKLHRHQQAVIREAEQRWFCVNAVGELHALHQAIYEQLLIHWKLIVSVELAVAPAQCLERSGDSILRGRGWQVVFPVKLIMDCCQNVQQLANARSEGASGDQLHSLSRSPVDSMVQALVVMEWHQELGCQVYEASLLERVYRFQYDFVTQKDASDKVSSFFFTGTDGDCSPNNEPRSQSRASVTSELVPIALDLVGEKEFVSVTSRSATGASKTVPEWLEAQITSPELQVLLDTLEDGDVGRKTHWQTFFLDFQRRWTQFLGDAVRYQDLIGAEIVEFASCSPFFFLESATTSDRDITKHRTMSSAVGNAVITTSSLNTKTVQSKYADEIAEKMTEEMQQNCYPYWISLEQLKLQLKKRFTGPNGPETKDPDSRSSFAVTAVEVPSVNDDEPQTNDPDTNSPNATDTVTQSYALRFDACAQYMDAEAAIPRHLVRVNRLLKRLRDERALMQAQSPAVFSTCAFAPNRFSEEYDSCKKNTLTRWLATKLQQLRQDLQQHSGNDTKRRSSYKVYEALGTTDFNGKAGDVCGSGEENQLLLSLPSQLYLIDQFAVPLCREQPSPAFSKAAALANDERATTLRSLCSILQAFHTGMDLIRVKSSFYFAMKRFKSSSAGFGRTGRHPSAGESTQCTSSVHTPAHGLLERWQTHFHEEIRVFHDRGLEYLQHNHQTSFATCNIYARNNDNKAKLANKAQWEVLQLIQAGVETSTKELAGFLQCMTSFLLMQMIGNKRFEQPGPDNMDSAAQPLAMVDQQSSQRKSLQRCLLSLSTRLKAKKGYPQGLDDGAEMVSHTSVAPVVSSASEMLRLFFKSSRTASASTRSEREVFAFWKELMKHQLDANYVSWLLNWLDLQRVFIAEYIRPALLPSAHPSGNAILKAASFEQEMAAVAALDKLWERYELIVPEHEYSELKHHPELATYEVSEVDDDHQTSPHLHHQPPVLVRRESRRGVHHQGSFAQRRDLAVFNLAASSSSMLLPSQLKLRHQAEFLRLHFELQWLQTDIMQMERHYASFLDQKKKSQQPRSQAVSALNQNSNQFQHHWKNDIHSPTLLALSKFYRSGEDPEEDGGNGLVTHSCDEFVIPASEMNILLQDLAAECSQHHLRQTEVYEHTIANLQHQLATAQRSLKSLQHESKRDHRQEALKRESYAIDHTYQLHFQVALLKKEIEAMENRMDLERLSLQCQLSDEYEKKLAAMHAQLLAKQQRFDEYRVVMQHDLHVQLQGAQTQLVHQLVDHSGSISVEMKANFLANLHGQHADDHVHKENVALKQTLLKLQSLLEMQQQTHGANHEREQMLHRRHKTSNLMLRNETAQLQQQIKQLESDMSKLSQEKTYYMLKWNNLHKQTEAAAQKKREAKIRALSAPYHRGVAAAIPPFPLMDGQAGSLEPLASNISVLESSHKPKSRVLKSFEDEEEAFERHHELAIRRQTPQTHSAGSGDAGDAFTGKLNDERSERHFQNSARHYQNEIRRLQQQLAKESKSKAVLMDQVVQLKAQLPSDADNQMHEGDDLGNPEAPSLSSVVKEDRIESSLRAYGGGFTLRTPNSSGSGARAPSASFGRMLTSLSSSPQVRAQSASICTPSRPQQQAPATPGSGVANKRPNTSFSPRASSLCRTQAAAANEIASPRSSGLPSPSASAVAGPGTPARKFEVQKRSESRIGGIAGVSNALSVREPLPYR